MHDEESHAETGAGHLGEEACAEELSRLSGGMRWEQLPRSANIEDRRFGGCRGSACGRRPPRRSPDLSRSKLARDAGIDDIGKHR